MPTTRIKVKQADSTDACVQHVTRRNEAEGVPMAWTFGLALDLHAIRDPNSHEVPPAWSFTESAAKFLISISEEKQS